MASFAKPGQTVIRRDPIQPGREIRVLPKIPNGTKSAQKDLLGRFGSVVRILQHSQHQVVNGFLPLEHKAIESSRVAPLAGFDPGRIAQTVHCLPC